MGEIADQFRPFCFVYNNLLLQDCLPLSGFLIIFLKNKAKFSCSYKKKDVFLLHKYLMLKILQRIKNVL